MDPTRDPNLGNCPDGFTRILESRKKAAEKKRLGRSDTTNSERRHCGDIRALINRIGFWGPLYYKDIEEPPKLV